MTRSSDKIAECLFEIIVNAKDEDQADLFKALHEFRTMYHRSYQGVKQQSFAAAMIGAIEEAACFMNEMADDDFNRHIAGDR